MNKIVSIVAKVGWKNKNAPSCFGADSRMELKILHSHLKWQITKKATLSRLSIVRTETNCNRPLLQESSRDNDLLDFGGPFVDLSDLGITEIALHVVLAHISIASVYLYRLEGALHCHL